MSELVDIGDKGLSMSSSENESIELGDGGSENAGE